jgi:exopolysaccharide biosynthesis polyprenyl glycosylphosphotransferase
MSPDPTSVAALAPPSQLPFTALRADSGLLAAPGGKRAAVLHRWLMLADAGGALIGGLIAASTSGLPIDTAFELGAACALLVPFLALICGLYGADDLRQWATGVPDLKRLLFAALLLSWPLSGMAHLAGAHDPVRATLIGTALTFALAATGRALARALAHHSPRLQERTAIIGSGLVAGDVVNKLRVHREFGLTPVGTDDNSDHHRDVDDLPHLGSLKELPAILQRDHIDRVIIAFTRAGHAELLQTIRDCRDARVPVHVIPRLFEFLDGARSLDHIGGLPILSLGAPRLTRVERAAKRGLDLVAATAGLVICAPLFAIIAVAIKAESRGRVFFRQPRAGRGTATFELVKFRSMFDGADDRKAALLQANEMPGGIMFKIQQDPRITRVGRVLRRFSLDELPQLWNVLRGEMSLVGPRPLVIPETEHLAEDWHTRRSELRPGITGPWQVYGRSELPFEAMVRFDYQYVAGWSLARDIEILCSTLPAVLSGRGAY